MERNSPRSYTGTIPSLPGTLVHFQRAGDIPQKIEEGSADIGISGLDRFMETKVEGGDSILVLEDLRFGKCELVIGVPDSWIDVTSSGDIADLCIELREHGTELRVATKYPRLVQSYLYRRGVDYFSLVLSSGTLEAAPSMGFADIIADISSSGATMRENHLKALPDGSILNSQACIIGNRRFLARDEAVYKGTRWILEAVEAHIRARDFFSITANIRGESPEEISGKVDRKTDLAGLKGPTIAKVFSDDKDGWYAVTLVVPRDRMQYAVDHLREIGGGTVTVFQPNYVFQDRCVSYSSLLEELGV